jgi:hypothetical protein
MELAMSGAAEVAQRVESRARMRNYSLKFTSEDIRAMGLTMFIQAMRERGVTWDRWRTALMPAHPVQESLSTKLIPATEVALTKLPVTDSGVVAGTDAAPVLSPS